MRVISGIRRGLKLKAPDGINTRPTTDRVKESVFNIIQTHLPANKVLDLFSGSGALGIEALSRGSENCVFVEKVREAYSITEYNLNLSKLSDKARLLFMDSVSYLKSACESFDIIFLDPPYNKGFISPVLSLISERGLLADKGIIVVETEKGGEEATHPDFKTIREATYGKTVINVLIRGEEK